MKAPTSPLSRPVAFGKAILASAGVLACLNHEVDAADPRTFSTHGPGFSQGATAVPVPRPLHIASVAPTRASVGRATACDTPSGRKLFVGPDKAYATIGAAAAAAKSDDVVLITAGAYLGDVAVWPQNNLTICGLGGRARLFANGRNAGGKGIWVIQGNNVVVDSIEFHDASVPDRNGAGIRAEGNGLTIINSGFFDNENGILGPNRGELTIVRSEFARNGFGDGYSHNVYVGLADKVSVTASFFHEAKIGHNFKTRAKETRIENSYFMDGHAGTASYQIDAPNGGVVRLSGNLVQKGPKADSAIVINYGSEGLRSGITHKLELVHNTLVSTYPGGTFLSVAPGVQSVTLIANLLAGVGSPTKFAGGVSAARVAERHNLLTTADNIAAPTSIAGPNFWPNQEALVERTALETPEDPAYVVDAPRPFTLRGIDKASRRHVGALQSPP